MPFDMVVNRRMATAQLDEIGPNVREQLAARLRPIAAEMAADAKSRAQAHIRFLGVKPGAYVASIMGGVSEKQTRVLGYVRSGSSLAHLLEHGAQTPPHVIQAAAKEAMKFGGSAGEVFAKRVKHPGATIPAYPAIQPAFDARKDDIRRAIEDSLGESVRKVF